MYAYYIHKFYKQRFLIIFLIYNIIYIYSINYTYAQEESRYKLKTVVIDAGHGGKDPGAVCKKGYEKDVTLSVVLKVCKLIEEHLPGVKVICTRNTDEFIELHKRAQIANSNKADIFISIHVNANKKPDPYGSETFVMGLHKTDENLEVAKAENSVITKEENYKSQYDGLDPNSPEFVILLTYYQNVFLEQSLSLAGKVQDQFRERAKRCDKGVKQAGFLVLWKTTMPSVLIETGFLSNPDEAAYLFSEKGQVQLASSIFHAFRNFKNQLEGNPMNPEDAISPDTGKAIPEKNYMPEETPKDTLPKVKQEPDSSILKSQKQDEQKLYVKPNDSKKDDTGKNNSNVNVQGNTATEKKEQTGVGKRDSVTVKANKNEPKKNENAKTETGIIFKVQIKSSLEKIPLSSPQFKGQKDLEEILIDDVYKYFTGSEKQFSKAVELQKKIRAGFPDAFIVAFKNGKKISLDEALKEIKN